MFNFDNVTKLGDIGTDIQDVSQKIFDKVTCVNFGTYNYIKGKYSSTIKFDSIDYYSTSPIPELKIIKRTKNWT